MQLLLSGWTTTIMFYLLCYSIVIFIMSYSLLLNMPKTMNSWNNNINSSKGSKLLLFICLLALTGLPPMFTLAPKLHLIAFILSKSSMLGTVILLILIFVSWFVYYSALRAIGQNNISNFLSTKRASVIKNKFGLVASVLLLFIIVSPFFVDDFIFWVYYFVGL